MIILYFRPVTYHLFFQRELEDSVLKKTEYECHSMKYYTLLEVTIGLRNAANYLMKVYGFL